VPKTKVAFLAFNQPRDNILTLSNGQKKKKTLSNKRGMGVTTLLNSRLFRSFHTTQTHKSHMSCIKERLALPPPVKGVNYNKWSEMLSVSAPEH